MRNSSSYLAEDTIVARASAAGGAISVVRISGPRAFAFLAQIAPSPVGREPTAPGTLSRRALFSLAGSPLDDALVARFVGPKSYTGEDVVELHIHGGHYLASRVIETLIEAGARPALPGEFSFRAVRNGKLSLSQAQAVADLISASNDGALALALEKLSGTQNALLAGLAGGLRHVAALAEAGIDFSDQDLDEVALPRLKAALGPWVKTLETLESGYRRGQRIQSGIRVALAGLPNAGKSSLFNALLGEDRSIVSPMEGTTRDVVGEQLTLRSKDASFTFRLEDTAGLRHASDTIEQMGIERTLKAVESAELLLYLVDSSAPGDPAWALWETLLGRFLSKGGGKEQVLVVFTKQDLVPYGGLRDRFDGVASVSTSAASGEGVDSLVMSLVAMAGALCSRSAGEVLLTREDHLQSARAALRSLRRAMDAPEHALFAADLRVALHELSPMLGETLPDDLLSEIFSSFCIGK